MLENVMRSLSQMPEVLSAEGVSGNIDVVALIQAPSLEVLQDTILSAVRGLNGVESTETWIVMVEQPKTWTGMELDPYLRGLDVNELAILQVLIEKPQGMFIPELVDAVSEHLSSEGYNINELTVSLINMRRMAEDEYRRETLLDFDPDVGYFLDEQYLDILETALTRLS